MPAFTKNVSFDLPHQSFVQPAISFWRVTTAFTNASVGHVLARFSWIAMFPMDTSSVVNSYMDSYLNLTTFEAIDPANVSQSNIEIISGASGSSDIVTSVNKVSSGISGLNTLNTTLVSNVSSGLSSLVNLNTLSNNGLSAISGGISTANILLGQVSNTLGTAFATATLNVEAVPANTTRNYNNVKSAIITAQPVLLATTLNTSSITVNGAVCSLNSPITIAIPPNTRLSNTLTISGGNIAVTVIYTT